MSTAAPAFVADLVGQLRRRGFVLGPEDVVALRQALGAGFGWSSRAALESLCVALWAKSAPEAEVVRAAFLRVDVPDLDPPAEPATPAGPAGEDAATPTDPAAGRETAPSPGPEADQPVGGTAVTAARLDGLPPIPMPASADADRRLVLVARYPVTERQAAQAWRRVRRPVRVGPPVGVDVEATIRRRSERGVATGPVLVPARRNAARMPVFIDAGGSMAPYGDYVEHLRRALAETARFEALTTRYFHNVPGRSPDRLLLDSLSDPLGRHVDEILGQIRPLPDGRVYTSPGLSGPQRLADLLDTIAGPSGAVVISDAGAARGRYDPVRLLDTIAFLKALRDAFGRLVWLNPTRVERWDDSTAGRVARHVPMFPLTEKSGLDRAVDALRGRSVRVEAPL